LTFTLPPTKDHKLIPAPQIPIKVLYEDENMFLINKASGISVHPGAGTKEATLIEALIAKYPELSLFPLTKRAGLVHRLDKDTTGVLLVAKNESTLDFLSAQFADRRVQKKYLAFVNGLAPKRGLMEIPIGRHPTLRHKMAALQKGGRSAKTGFKLLKSFPKTGISLLSISLFTGRTHQARVHLASQNLPVLGDKVYGKNLKQLIKSFPSLEPLVKRQLLHARRLSIPDPKTGGYLKFSSPWPDDFKELFKELVSLENSERKT
jgi:23S rRNA pseudouridine1911/1915/1917 synthase